jgi:hypothetical protein
MAEIDVSKLTGEQLDETACVVCKHTFAEPDRPTAVGYLGSDHHFVFACPRPCARSIDRLVTDNRPKHALTASAVQWPA